MKRWLVPVLAGLFAIGALVWGALLASRDGRFGGPPNRVGPPPVVRLYWQEPAVPKTPPRVSQARNPAVETVLPAAASGLLHADLFVRQKVFAGLAKQGMEAFALLVELTRHPDERLAIPGVLGITLMCAREVECEPVLAAALSHEHPAVVFLAARGLSMMNAKARDSIPDLIAAGETADDHVKWMCESAASHIQARIKTWEAISRGEDSSGLLAGIRDTRRPVAPVAIRGGLIAWGLSNDSGRAELALFELRCFSRLGRLAGPREDFKTVDSDLVIEVLRGLLKATITLIEDYREQYGVYPRDLDALAAAMEWKAPTLLLGFSPLSGEDHAELRYYQLDSGLSYRIGGEVRYARKGLMGWRSWALEHLGGPGSLKAHPGRKDVYDLKLDRGRWTVWRGPD